MQTGARPLSATQQAASSPVDDGCADASDGDGGDSFSLQRSSTIAGLRPNASNLSPDARRSLALANRCALLQLNMMHIFSRLRELEAWARIEAAAAAR